MYSPDITFLKISLLEKWGGKWRVYFSKDVLVVEFRYRIREDLKRYVTKTVTYSCNLHEFGYCRNDGEALDIICRKINGLVEKERDFLKEAMRKLIE